MAKKQKNFRLSEECCEALKTRTLRLIAEGHKVDETAVAEMAILQFCIATEAPAIHSEPKTGGKRIAKREAAIQERASSDLIAQEAGRDDIDYSDVESTPATHIIKAATLRTATGARSLESWRASRKPLLKPKDLK